MRFRFPWGCIGDVIRCRLGGARLLQFREFRGWHEDSHGPRLARGAFDETVGVKSEQHLVDRWRSDTKEALQIGFGRWASVDLRVVVDEGQVLALLGGEAWCRGRSQGDHVLSAW
jgi:hypothetical protein